MTFPARYEGQAHWSGPYADGYILTIMYRNLWGGWQQRPMWWGR